MNYGGGAGPDRLGAPRARTGGHGPGRPGGPARRRGLRLPPGGPAVPGLRHPDPDQAELGGRNLFWCPKCQRPSRRTFTATPGPVVRRRGAAQADRSRIRRVSERAPTARRHDSSLRSDRHRRQRHGQLAGLLPDPRPVHPGRADAEPHVEITLPSGLRIAWTPCDLSVVRPGVRAARRRSAGNVGGVPVRRTRPRSTPCTPPHLRRSPLAPRAVGCLLGPALRLGARSGRQPGRPVRAAALMAAAHCRGRGIRCADGHRLDQRCWRVRPPSHWEVQPPPAVGRPHRRGVSLGAGARLWSIRPRGDGGQPDGRWATTRP